MPRLALALCLLWFVCLFVVRSVAQWRRTGSTGFRGFHGAVGSIPWIAGVAVSAGFVLTLLVPPAALLGWPGGALLVSSTPLHLAGAVCTLAGIVGVALAQRAMGDAWRIGVDESERTELVTTGPFAWVRNPIFSFLWLSVLGLLMLVPSPLSLLAGGSTVIGIEMQVRAVEEPYLRSVHGATYLDYASRVGRFVPGIGRIDRGRRGVPEGLARG